METERTPEERVTIHRGSVEIWDANAGFWDDHMGDSGKDSCVLIQTENS